MYDKDWAKVDLNVRCPSIKTELPGAKVQGHCTQRAAKIMKGYSSQVKLFPVVF